MELALTVVCENAAQEKIWEYRIQQVAGPLLAARISLSSELQSMEAWSEVVFLDEKHPGLKEILEKLNRNRRAVFLLSEEKSGVPEVYLQGKVDDVLIYPFRDTEFLSKVQRYQHLVMWDEVSKLNASFSEVLEHLKADLMLATRLQKNRLPVKFPNVKGFHISTRYLAGMKSGGDHLDLAESKDKGLLSVVLSDSSSYGLSSAVLSALMRVALRLSHDEARSCVETVARIQNEIQATLSEKDRLSLFYGVISRKDYRLRYLNLGSSSAFYAKKGGDFAALPATGTALDKDSPAVGGTPQELALEPESRLLLLSDGFVDAVGGGEGVLNLLRDLKDKDEKEMLNEFVFRVKSKCVEPDDMPAQDCTAALFGVDPRVIRLA